MPPKPSDIERRLEAFLEEFGPHLRSCVRRVSPRGLGLQAAEIEQEVRIRLWKALAGEREIQDAASYLYRVAVTAAIDAVRRVKARREESLETEVASGLSSLPVEEPGASPEALAHGRQLLDRVHEALGRLPENRRRVVRLHLQGFGSQEIADLLDWTEAKARNLVYRGLEDLRRELRAMGIEGAP